MAHFVLPNVPLMERIVQPYVMPVRADREARNDRYLAVLVPVGHMRGLPPWPPRLAHRAGDHESRFVDKHDGGAQP